MFTGVLPGDPRAPGLELARASINHHPAMTTVASIKKNVVALRMPLALEALDATFRRIEQCEIDCIEACDSLLIEELTVRENRRVKTELMMA